MSYGEAFRITQHLALDPSSAVCASLNDWAYPLSRDALVLMDIFDLQHLSKSKRKPPAYTRPWPEREKRTFARTALARDELMAILNAHREATS